MAEDDQPRGRGRPSKYDPAFVERAKKLCVHGFTDVEIADFFEVSVSTLSLWKVEHPEFSEALKAAKREADARVEASLYHKALGYSFDAVKIFMPAGATEPVYAPYREHVPPDTTAAIFWLKNRQSDRWRYIQKHEHGNAGDFDKMSDAELRALVAERSAVPGKGHAGIGTPRGSGGAGSKPN